MKLKSLLSDYQYWNIARMARKKKRSPRTIGFSSAKTAGIVFRANHPGIFEKVKNFVVYLQEKHIEVFVLGYVESNDLIDYYLVRKGFEFITLKDINWQGLPKKSATGRFLQRNYDLFFDLNTIQIPPLLGITVNSNATFRIGKFFPEHNYVDFSIDFTREQQTLKEVRDEVKIQSHQGSVKKSWNNSLGTTNQDEVDHEIETDFLIEQIKHYVPRLKH
jgi:hypothetical protein